MNAVEIEEAISALAELPFDGGEFPFAFLQAFGNKDATIKRLRASPATAKANAKFILTTDGDGFEAEELESGETVACAYADFPNHFGFFLPLAGITTVKQIRESAARVRQGGHDIPEPVIRRRFVMGWTNFQRRYKQAVDDWALYDNAAAEPVMLEWGENQ